MRGRQARPKIGDVAVAARVSVGTVSAVLNGTGRIGSDTRRRVQEVIAALGYRPDFYARNLARRETRVLGVLVSNLANPFFAETAQAVEEEAARHGYQTSLMTSNFSQEQHRAAVKQLLGARVAGLAVLTSEGDDEARSLVRSSGVPAVFLDVGKPEQKISTMRVDARDGMKAAVEHLIELGHRSLLYVQNSQAADGTQLLTHRLRKAGFAAAVKAYAHLDLRTQVVDVRGPGADAGEQATVSVMRTGRFSAVVAMTDVVAMGVYRGLETCGLKVPEQVSVVGFDDTYFSRFLNPPLTTVHVPQQQLSRVVVQKLLSGKAGQMLHLATNLVVRWSTAPPHRSFGT